MDILRSIVKVNLYLESIFLSSSTQVIICCCHHEWKLCRTSHQQDDKAHQRAIQNESILVLHPHVLTLVTLCKRRQKYPWLSWVNWRHFPTCSEPAVSLRPRGWWALILSSSQEEHTQTQDCSPLLGKNSIWHLTFCFLLSEEVSIF